MATTRRDFLGGVIAAAALGSGCAHSSEPIPPEAAGPRRIGPPRERARVALVRPSAFADVGAALRAAIDAFGGVPGLRAGDTVCLKPALNSEKPYPATASPETVGAMAKLALEAGARPFIADRTMFARGTGPVMEKTGMNAVAARLGIRALPLDDARTLALSDARATHWGQTVHLYAPPLEATHLINLCTPRTHKLAGFTLALKNNVGLVASGRRIGMHGPGGFPQRVAELNLFTRPTLVVMDGRQGFTTGGPDEGTLTRPDFLAVSDDPVAIDAIAMTLLHRAGAKLVAGTVAADPILARAAELGIGVVDLARIELLSEDAALKQALGPGRTG